MLMEMAVICTSSISPCLFSQELKEFGISNETLDVAASVAGWNRRSPIQLRYLRKDFGKLVIASRLVSNSREGPTSTLYDFEAFQNPEIYHGLDLATSVPIYDPAYSLKVRSAKFYFALSSLSFL
jgi:hypothetical protein